VVTSIGYAAIILPQLSTTPVADIEYQGLLLATIGAAVLLAIVAAIIIAISAPREAGKADQRDKDIGRFGEYVGGSVLAVCAVVPFLMALAELDYFWIANSLYLAFVLGAVTGAVARIWAYRRGV
jgi:hypothetical protein